MRKASYMGLVWGLGHATTLVVVGLPLMLAHRHLPGVILRAAEVLVGMIIVILAVRLILRWRSGL